MNSNIAVVMRRQRVSKSPVPHLVDSRLGHALLRARVSVEKRLDYTRPHMLHLQWQRECPSWVVYDIGVSRRAHAFVAYMRSVVRRQASSLIGNWENQRK